MAQAQVWSIVVAGGSGQRFGQRKQFALLAGRPVLEWAVDASRSVCGGVVLVLPAGTDADETHGADIVVRGGPTRAMSVGHGLAAVPPDADVIVVHDAARPLASPSLFRAVVDAVGQTEVDGAVPGIAVSDTIKVVDETRTVTKTLERDTLVAVQTPQAFRAGVLRQAHEESATGAPTDDAMMVEARGGRVRVVDGDPGNLKITTPEDLETASRLLAARGA